MNRQACSKPAGPTYFSGFHHQDGHCDEQQPQRMHSYSPSSLARSSGDCRRSMGGAGSSLISQGLMLWYCWKNRLWSTTRSRMTGIPGRGLMISVLPFPSASATGVMQPRRFLPLMFMPSEPQTPSRQERR
ncbi:hypothetical protein D3C72_1986070 [compost metagenome]